MKQSKRCKIISSIAVFGSLGLWMWTLKFILKSFHWTVFLTYMILSAWILMGVYMNLLPSLVMKIEEMEKEEDTS